MRVTKQFAELASYAITIHKTTVIPFSIEADDTTCTVVFKTVRDKKPDEVNGETNAFEKIFGEFTRTGTHEEFFFTTTLVDDVPVKINLKTGQMTKEGVIHKSGWDGYDDDLDLTEPANQLRTHIKIVNDEVIQISAAFAENNLSEICRGLADYKTEQYYEWTLGASAYAVFYEIPSVFHVDIQDINIYLPQYCLRYMDLMGFDANSLISQFRENYNKKIII